MIKIRVSTIISQNLKLVRSCVFAVFGTQMLAVCDKYRRIKHQLDSINGSHNERHIFV